MKLQRTSESAESLGSIFAIKIILIKHLDRFDRLGEPERLEKTAWIKGDRIVGGAEWAEWAEWAAREEAQAFSFSTKKKITLQFMERRSRGCVIESRASA